MMVLWRLMLRAFRSPPAPLKVLVLLVAVLGYGSTGFLYYELPNNPQLTWLDGVWYALVTVTTVGYGDLSPASLGGRFVVALPLMFVGIGLFGYVLSLAASSLVAARTKELHGMADHKLSRHLVIFNFPSLDKLSRVLDELEGDKRLLGDRSIVLIDEDLTELPPELAARNVVFVKGNPTRDETLTRASVDDAAYAMVLSKRSGDSVSDNQAVAITLAIEARNHKVFTVVECVDFTTQELLKKAGCDGIVCTSRFDAHFLTHELLNPGVQEVVDQLTSNLRGQQIYLTRYSGHEAASFDRLASRCRELGHLAIGIHRGESAHLNLEPSFAVRAGDAVISIGSTRLDELR